jgi:hypothetical protein
MDVAVLTPPAQFLNIPKSMALNTSAFLNQRRWYVSSSSGATSSNMQFATPGRKISLPEKFQEV